MTRPDREQRPASGAGGEDGQDESSRGTPPPIVDLDFLRGLISAVDDSGVDSLEISRGGTRIRIAKTPSPTHSTVVSTAGAHALPAPAVSNWVEIKSPMVGTFYRSPSPEAPSYVEIGSRVTKGQTLCILEAMKLMNELESDHSGIIREITVENGQPVEYGQVLYRLEPDA